MTSHFYRPKTKTVFYSFIFLGGGGGGVAVRWLLVGLDLFLTFLRHLQYTGMMAVLFLKVYLHIGMARKNVMASKRMDSEALWNSPRRSQNPGSAPDKIESQSQRIRTTQSASGFGPRGPKSRGVQTCWDTSIEGLPFIGQCPCACVVCYAAKCVGLAKCVVQKKPVQNVMTYSM